MKVTGIVAEYNPFHNGHLYQYEQIKKQNPDGHIIVVISGNFVQRGEPSIYDKYTRTRAALSAGADVVMELPAVFATGSAEDFSAAAIALLDRLHVVDELCFGSECGNITHLSEVAQVLANEPEPFGRVLREHMRAGLSFPKARNLALLAWLGAETGDDAKRKLWTDLLTLPNNLLGIEYLKALMRRKSTIKPVTITRLGQGYHDTALGGDFASASGLRVFLSRQKQTDDFEPLLKQVPHTAAALYRQATPVFPDDCSLLLNEKLLYLHHHMIPYDRYADISEELSHRMEKQLLEFASFSERILQLKSKQYTYTRISRGLLHVLLDMKKADIAQYRSADYAPYARILGFRREALPLMSMMKKNSAIPLITKTAAARHILTGLPLQMFMQDLYCSHMYQAISQRKSGIRSRNEYTQSVIVI